MDVLSKDAIQKVVAKNLKEYRTSKGFTVLQFTEKLNLSKAGYEKWEKGEKVLSVVDVIRIAAITEEHPRAVLARLMEGIHE